MSPLTTSLQLVVNQTFEDLYAYIFGPGSSICTVGPPSVSGCSVAGRSDGPVSETGSVMVHQQEHGGGKNPHKQTEKSQMMICDFEHFQRLRVYSFIWKSVFARRLNRLRYSGGLGSASPLAR